MYQANERVLSSGLYRCTTCGVMIPLNADEQAPKCPSRCEDAIWTFFNEKWAAPATEVRGVTESFQALDLDGDPRVVPVGAKLTDVRLGPAQAGKPNRDATLAAFQCEGHVYFGSAHELFKKTEVIHN